MYNASIEEYIMSLIVPSGSQGLTTTSNGKTFLSLGEYMDVIVPEMRL